jgi:3',5'-cyclic AMP phosphodiesterase CpdA
MIPGLQKHLSQLQMPWYPSHGNHDMIDEPGWQQAFGHPYNYVVEKENSAFVFLNTANEKGKYIQGDVDWVNSQFEKFGRKEHLFVIMHITPFNWTEAGFPHPEMVQLFSKQKNLKAVFHGHDHLEDGWKEHEGKYYFFDGHTGGSWGVPYHGYRVVDVLADGTIYLYQKNPALQQPVNELRVNKHTARV